MCGSLGIKRTVFDSSVINVVKLKKIDDSKVAVIYDLTPYKDEGCLFYLCYMVCWLDINYMLMNLCAAI